MTYPIIITPLQRAEAKYRVASDRVNRIRVLCEDNRANYDELAEAKAAKEAAFEELMTVAAAGAKLTLGNADSHSLAALQSEAA